VNVDSSVTVQTTIEAIDHAKTTIDSHGSHVIIWADSTDDTSTSLATLHSVSSFMDGVSKSTSASMPNPTDTASTTIKPSLSLFGAGPAYDDVNQGSITDSFLMAPLAALAKTQPSVIQNSIVDMGDGTYTVQLFNSAGTADFVRVSDVFGAGSNNGYFGAAPGAHKTIWAAVMEKAFAYFYSKANTYASIDSGSVTKVYTDLGLKSSQTHVNSYTSDQLYTRFTADKNAGKAVTLTTSTTAPNLLPNTEYTLRSVQHVNGAVMFTLRDPSGKSGSSLEDSTGAVTLTFAQLIANFKWVTEQT
jgi:hypothetical protein